MARYRKVSEYLGYFTIPIFTKNSGIDTLNEMPFIGLEESGYQVNSFLISQRKHMLWVLIRSTSVRHF